MNRTKTLILSNSALAIRHNLTLESPFELNFNTKDFGIKNKTLISNELKIKYLISNEGTKKNQVCARCHKTPEHHHVGLQSLKILGVWDDGGYVEIKFNTPEEEKFFSDIIRAMRKNFFHGRNVCALPSCEKQVEAEFKSLKDQAEVGEALNDVKTMHQEQERNQ